MIVSEITKEMQRNKMGGRSVDKVAWDARCVDNVGAEDVNEERKDEVDEIGCAPIPFIRFEEEVSLVLYNGDDEDA